VAMYYDVVHISIRRSRSAQVDGRNSVWMLGCISTKELFKKDTNDGPCFDLCIHVYRPCGIGHHRNGRFRLGRSEETADGPATVSIFRWLGILWF
jgi:hypothetical protein